MTEPFSSQPPIKFSHSSAKSASCLYNFLGLMWSIERHYLISYSLLTPGTSVNLEAVSSGSFGGARATKLTTGARLHLTEALKSTTRARRRADRRALSPRDCRTQPRGSNPGTCPHKLAPRLGGTNLL